MHSLKRLEAIIPREKQKQKNYFIKKFFRARKTFFTTFALILFFAAISKFVSGCTTSKEAAKKEDGKKANPQAIDSTSFQMKNTLAIGDTVPVGAFNVTLESMDTSSLESFKAVLVLVDKDSATSEPRRLELGLYEVSPILPLHGKLYVFALSAVIVGKEGEKPSIEIMAKTTYVPKEIPALISKFGSNPNPFNQSTTITYGISKSAHVNITIYDMIGKVIAVLHNGAVNSGEHSVNFDASGFPAGTYFAVIKVGDEKKIIKIVYVK